MKLVLAQINPTVGDLNGNTAKVLDGIKSAKEAKADLVIFPELCLSGYPPDDFLLLKHFTKEIASYLKQVIQASDGIAVIVGLPRHHDGDSEKPLYNSAAIIENQTLLGYQDKWLLPTYDVFDERRYFAQGKSHPLWEIQGKKVAVTICEDLWQHTQAVKQTQYRRDPIEEMCDHPPDLLINIAASPFRQLKMADRLNVCQGPAQTLGCSVVLCNQVGGNDSLIFDGFSMHVNAQGELVDVAKGFEEDHLLIDLTQEKKALPFVSDPIENLYDALVLGVRDYFHKLDFTKACLGLSGGVDSAVVACIAKEALGKENVLAVTMPSRFSSDQNRQDAQLLINNLGIDNREISIEPPFQAFLDLLEPLFAGHSYDATEENLQARIRGMILMALSNKLGHIVLNCGNKSELAMGYATLYGDLCGGLGVISDVTKLQVYALAKWINRNKEIIPEAIFTKPPSAELRDDQKDSDQLPDYAIIDDVVKQYVEEHRDPEEIAAKGNYPQELIDDLIRKIHYNEYKRRQSPPGLRVSAKAFSIGRRFPIVQRWV